MEQTVQRPGASIAPPAADGNGTAALRRRRFIEPFHSLALRYPFASFFLMLIFSNVAGSAFNIYYNKVLIVSTLSKAQQDTFNYVALPVYNVIAYPVCVAAMLLLLHPLRRCLYRLRAGEAVEPEHLDYCRRRLVNLPALQLIVNFSGWIPGAVFFPLVLCMVEGEKSHAWIWLQFIVSFVVAALFTTAQTFFIMESFLVNYFYPVFFRDARPEEVRGGWHFPYWIRLVILWAAVALMPLVAIYFAPESPGVGWFPTLLLALSAVSSFAIFGLVGSDLLHWVNLHSVATEEVAHGNFGVRIDEQRPDEWGRLTNHFNDMAGALERGEELRETFGQFVGPETRDAILARYPGLRVSVQEITVLFADIRGFTRRCAHERPENVGTLLNAFLSLALRAIEERGGYVNKFLGDGVMALFNVVDVRDDHADLAIGCAHDLLLRLEELNRDLKAKGEEPLAVGIGIHTGPALVGCFGATVTRPDGRIAMRRELSAIGATVNFAQRIEQLTKTCGGPILISEATRLRLLRPVCATCQGPQSVPGAPEPLVVHRVLGA